MLVGREWILRPPSGRVGWNGRLVNLRKTRREGDGGLVRRRGAGAGSTRGEGWAGAADGPNDAESSARLTKLKQWRRRVKGYLIQRRWSARRERGRQKNYRRQTQRETVGDGPRRSIGGNEVKAGGEKPGGHEEGSAMQTAQDPDLTCMQELSPQCWPFEMDGCLRQW